MSRSQFPTYAYYADLPEPNLEFGCARVSAGTPIHNDPQMGLAQFGPYSVQLGGRWHPPVTRVVPVACDVDFEDVAATLERLAAFERIEATSPYVRIDYPGYAAAYRSEFEMLRNVPGQIIPRKLFDEALRHHQVANGFRGLIRAIEEAVDSVISARPDAILAIYLPRDIVTQFRTLTPDFQLATGRSKHRKQKDDRRQMVLFEDLLDEDDNETLYHDLRRAIKVRAMQKGAAVQLLTDSFLLEEPSQPWAGKFWNVSCALFCKAGGIPWRLPTSENIAHCGIRFGISKNAVGTKILVGIAQVFSASGELVALRAGQATKDTDRTSEAGYYLSKKQASFLISEAVADYEVVTGRIPDRLLIHKSSYFKPEEIEGIENARKGVREVDLVYIKRGTPFRLLPAGGQPAPRGTVVPTSDDSALVYLTGYIPSEGSWRGKHIPAPVELVRCKSNRSMLDLSEEVLRLTKMNWNTTIYSSRNPCTFSNATEMIGMMKELRSGESLRPQIRYYI